MTRILLEWLQQEDWRVPPPSSSSYSSSQLLSPTFSWSVDPYWDLGPLSVEASVVHFIPFLSSKSFTASLFSSVLSLIFRICQVSGWWSDHRRSGHSISWNMGKLTGLARMLDCFNMRSLGCLCVNYIGEEEEIEKLPLVEIDSSGGQKRRQGASDDEVALEKQTLAFQLKPKVTLMNWLHSHLFLIYKIKPVIVLLRYQDRYTSRAISTLDSCT